MTHSSMWSDTLLHIQSWLVWVALVHATQFELLSAHAIDQLHQQRLIGLFLYCWCICFQILHHTWPKQIYFLPFQDRTTTRPVLLHPIICVSGLVEFFYFSHQCQIFSPILPRVSLHWHMASEAEVWLFLVQAGWTLKSISLKEQNL